MYRKRLCLNLILGLLHFGQWNEEDVKKLSRASNFVGIEPKPSLNRWEAAMLGVWTLKIKRAYFISEKNVNMKKKKREKDKEDQKKVVRVEKVVKEVKIRRGSGGWGI